MKLSIITINRNNAAGLKKTMESVLTQTCNDFEYIVVDGAAPLNPPKGGLLKNPHPLNPPEGGTSSPVQQDIEVIEKFISKIGLKENGFTSCTFLSPFGGVGGGFFSEPDKGIYNAMNKGILKAQGEYLLFLNSGDWLYDDRVVEDFCSRNFTEDLVAGNLMNWNNGKRTLRKFYSGEELGFLHFYCDSPMAHQATFIKKTLFEKYGLYNEKHAYVSDWEFFVVALLVNQCSYSYFDRIISYYDLTGITAQPQVQEKLAGERATVMNRYFPLVARSFKLLLYENEVLKSHENRYNEYEKLRSSVFGPVVKLLARIVRKLSSK